MRTLYELLSKVGATRKLYYSVKTHFLNLLRREVKEAIHAILASMTKWSGYIIILCTSFYCGRAMHDAAQEIRTKKIEREEGVALVNKYDAELPEEFVDDYLDYMDMSESQFLAL